MMGLTAWAQRGNTYKPLPTISLNFGINNLMSDVKLSKPGPSPFLQFGYQLTLTQRVVKFINVSLDLYTGTVYGEQMVNLTNLNFRTSMFSQRLSFEYNFYPLVKRDEQGRQLIRPYVGLGVGMTSFRSKGDLKDAHGVSYQFWSDGTINAEPEGSISPSEATPLERDFVYETDLRDANLDGLRKYPQLALTVPFNAGIRFQVSKNVGLNAAFSYCMNFSDMLDNVSTAGVGDRYGSAGNDNHFYGSIGLSVFLGNARPTSKTKPVQNENLPHAPDNKKKQKEKELKQEKSESVSDKSLAESSNGKENPTSGKTALGEQDNAVEPTSNKPQETPEQAHTTTQRESNQVSGNEAPTETVAGGNANTSAPTNEKKHVNLAEVDLSTAQPKKTHTFSWADVDESGWISPDEVLHFIDLLFEGDSEKSIEDIQNLIDYYFDQE